jgi:hypothetical protein
MLMVLRLVLLLLLLRAGVSSGEQLYVMHCRSD